MWVILPPARRQGRDLLASSERSQLCAIDVALRRHFEIFDASIRQPQLGLAQRAVKALVVSCQVLGIDEQREACVEVQFGAQQQLMGFLHAELGRLVGRALVSEAEPSPKDLSPRCDRRSPAQSKGTVKSRPPHACGSVWRPLINTSPLFTATSTYEVELSCWLTSLLSRGSKVLAADAGRRSKAFGAALAATAATTKCRDGGGRQHARLAVSASLACSRFSRGTGQTLGVPIAHDGSRRVHHH
jgi:hypothetical protein